MLGCKGLKDWKYECALFEAEEGIEIEDRVAFACKYLPDHKVGTQHF